MVFSEAEVKDPTGALIIGDWVILVFISRHSQTQKTLQQLQRSRWFSSQKTEYDGPKWNRNDFRRNRKANDDTFLCNRIVNSDWHHSQCFNDHCPGQNKENFENIREIIRGALCCRHFMPSTVHSCRIGYVLS